MRVLALCLLAATMTGCSKTEFASLGGNENTVRYEKNNVRNLNSISARRASRLKINFDNLHYASLFENHGCVMPMIYPPPPSPPECDNKPQALISLSGRGRLAGDIFRPDGKTVAVFEGVHVEVTYDAALDFDRLKTQTCLFKAQQALHQRRRFQIVGDGSLVHEHSGIYFGQPGTTPSGGSAERLFEKGAAIRDGRDESPQFLSLPLGLGISLNSIESCEIGEPIVDDPLVDPPPLCDSKKTSASSKSLPVVECLPVILDGNKN